MSNKLLGLLAILLLTGCSSHHPYIPPDQAHYGPPQWNADGELVRYRVPSQLTPVGCFLHQWTFGLGHKAEECIKPKKAAVVSMSDTTSTVRIARCDDKIAIGGRVYTIKEYYPYLKCQ